MNPTLHRLIVVLIVLVTPFFLILTAIRVLFTPLYLQVEYRMPGFPADLYGFSMEDRLKWAGVSMEYLLNDSDISFLADQRLPDGSPLYNERELSHMVDVKVVLQRALAVWGILLLAFIGLGFWAWRAGWLRDYFRALSNGSILTLVLMALILVGVAVSFYQLFTYFHLLFFEGDTWLFNYSDTLIRLFPLRFWQDGFILMGAVTVLCALILIGLYRTRFRKTA
jgi:integral membrane protein (TIGR01906 family)